MIEETLYHNVRTMLVYLEAGNFNVLQQFSLTVAQFDTLCVLSSQDGLRMGELCQRLLCDNSKMTRLIDALEKRDLVERRADPSDRRAQKVFITAEGDKLRQEATAVHTQYLIQQFSPLTQTEQNQLNQFITKLYPQTGTNND